MFLKMKVIFQKKVIMEDFKLNDMVLMKDKENFHVWTVKTYIGIGSDGDIYFADGYHTKPCDVEMMYINENTIKYKGTNYKKPWIPNQRELVAVKNTDNEEWQAREFVSMENGKYLCRINNRYSYWNKCESINNFI